MRTLRQLAGLVALCVVPVACGVLGRVSVSPDELERAVSARLTETLGQRPDKVDCPDSLAGEVGAGTRCVVTSEGMRYRTDIRVTSVEGNRVNFEIDVDEQPLG